MAQRMSDRINEYVMKNPGQTVTEVATALGTSPQNVSVVLRRRNLHRYVQKRRCPREVAYKYIMDHPGLSLPQYAEALSMDIRSVREAVVMYKMHDIVKYNPKKAENSKRRKRAKADTYKPAYYGRPYGSGFNPEYTKLM